MTTRTIERWILPLGDPEATRDRVGGKGASLASLAAAKFPVPSGFLIDTVAYRHFVDENRLQEVIAEQLAATDDTDPVALQRAEEAIQAAFQRGVIPPEIVRAINAAYAAFGVPEPAVAVRSSATAEDLPGLSFAGQQETFLDVRGQPALREAVIGCWASLWTARAIGYRQQMGIAQDDVAMAVVVQEMVPAEISGVLFAANPATGQHTEMVIEAALGLGEGIVGGTVTPESYLIDRQSQVIKGIVPGEQRSEANASEFSVMPPGSGGQLLGDRVLPDALIRALVELGERVVDHYGGTPQDIEWAIAEGKLWLLQARPITNLPPAPLDDVRWESPIPGATWVRRQVVEHMPEPLSPLFEELYLREGLERSARAAGRAMGVGDVYERMFEGPFFITVNGFGYLRGNFDIRWPDALRLLRVMARMPQWLFGHGIKNWRDVGLPGYLATMARWQEVNVATTPDETLLRGIRELAHADALYWFTAAMTIGAAKISDSILEGFLHLAMPGRDLHSGLFLRGYPSKTLEAEANLDAIADRARTSPELREYVRSTPAENLLNAVPQTPAGERLRDDLARYFARNGHQIYNLDFVAPTLSESPLPVLIGLKALVSHPGRDALERQAEVARDRDRLVAETAASLDPVRRFLFIRLVHWAQRFAPYREDALFYVGAAWPLLRRFAGELGRRLTAAELLEAAEDVYFLESDELAEASEDRTTGRERSDLARLAAGRRELREARKRLHPPAAVPSTSRMRIGRFDLSGFETQRRNLADGATLRGFAVSPGRVTAPASVILSPDDFARMEPGTILVCPTTTPAWTPLFAQARGLVTDIGGILAHGSIVAREYGIPAVMGTGNATRRIASGQQITIDGSAGTVSLAAG